MALTGTYFVSVACGLLVSHWVFREAQALREAIYHAAKSEITPTAADQRRTYASFCAARWNGKCGWMGYHILYIDSNEPLVATRVAGKLIVLQFFTQRASISIDTGAVTEWRSAD